MKKPRVAVIRLYFGGFLTLSGNGSYAKRAAQFKEHDAKRLFTWIRLVERNDPLWGASIELLEKRKTHAPMSDEMFAYFLRELQISRLNARAVRLEQDAAIYLRNAKDAERNAAGLRAQAEQLGQGVHVQKVIK